jgi:hypothetical protein
MKRVFLLMFVSALLATLGFAQTPNAGSNTDQANVKGCLGGSDGNYTVAEDGTRQIFKITTSSVDLKPHLGHEVKLIGHKASGGVGSGASDNSFAVTELNMISEHCAAAAAAGATTVSPSSAPVSTPPADTAHPTRLSAHPRRLSAKQAAANAAAAATASPAAETVGPAAADAATINATAASPAAETASKPDAAATTPTVTHRAGSLSLLISFVVLVIVLGTLVPLLSRWRKRKMLERTGTPNLSFTKEASKKEASSDQNKPAPRKVA